MLLSVTIGTIKSLSKLGPDQEEVKEALESSDKSPVKTPEGVDSKDNFAAFIVRHGAQMFAQLFPIDNYTVAVRLPAVMKGKFNLQAKLAEEKKKLGKKVSLKLEETEEAEEEEVEEEEEEEQEAKEVTKEKQTTSKKERKTKKKKKDDDSSVTPWIIGTVGIAALVILGLSFYRLGRFTER